MSIRSCVLILAALFLLAGCGNRSENREIEIVKGTNAALLGKSFVLSRKQWLEVSDTLKRDRNAFIIIIYDVDDKGALQNVRLIGSEPSGRFGEYIAASMRRMSFSAHAAQKEQIVRVSFPKQPKIQAIADDVTALSRDVHAQQIQLAITEKMYLPKGYKAKTCTIKLHLLPDGSLQGFDVLKGDKELCEAASNAVQQAELPRINREQDYPVFKNIVIEFAPR